MVGNGFGFELERLHYGQSWSIVDENSIKTHLSVHYILM